MSIDIRDLVYMTAALGSGITAGLFFVFSNTVMTALGRLEPKSGIAAMQSINSAILNPAFLFVLMGTAVLSAAAGIIELLQEPEYRSLPALAGSALYLTGTFLVTGFANVPMNKILDEVEPGSGESERFWVVYRSRWTRWNHVRTITATTAAAAYILAA